MDASSVAWAWPVGVALALFAPLLLARAWRRGREGRTARTAGWSALGAAMLLLTAATSVGRGVAFALVLLPFPALIAIGFRPDRRQARPFRRESHATSTSPSTRGRGLRTALRTSTALLAVVAAILVTTVIARVLFDPVVGVVASMALVVCLAAGGIAWAIADRLWWRPAVALAGVALFAFIALRA